MRHELGAEADAKHRAPLSQGAGDELHLALQKGPARVPDVCHSHRPAHDDQHVVPLYRGRHGRAVEERVDDNLEPHLARDVRDASRPLHRDVLQDLERRHRGQSCAIRSF
jgi:hypothetical protein